MSSEQEAVVIVGGYPEDFTESYSSYLQRHQLRSHYSSNSSISNTSIDTDESSDYPRTHKNWNAFSRETSRRDSFASWPTLLKDMIEPLVESGMFYTGHGDFVRCFSCGTSLQEFKEDDDLWEKHLNASPNCTFAMASRKTFIVKEPPKMPTAEKIEVEIEHTYNCPICMENCQGPYALVPCGHSACLQCVSKVKYCFVCRKLKERKLRIYL